MAKTVSEKPPPEKSTHWNSRLLADEMGLNHVDVWRTWSKFGLKPHKVRRFKLSRDPRLVEKLNDVVGVYLNPPDNAVVFAFDEKSQIQALDRTQPGLPLKRGRAGTMTHDYKRQGTTTLFAALDVATGHVIHDCMPKHRHQEFLKFMKTVVRSVEPELEVHALYPNSTRQFGKGNLTSQRRVVGWKHIVGDRMVAASLPRSSSRSRSLGSYARS